MKEKFQINEMDQKAYIIQLEEYVVILEGNLLQEMRSTNDLLDKVAKLQKKVKDLRAKLKVEHLPTDREKYHRIIKQKDDYIEELKSKL